MSLKELHLEHIWESEKIELGRNFSTLVKKLIKQREESEWREQLEKKSKLRTYRKLKTRLVLEEYVVELDREQRRHLTMLRGGTNKLRIETGRWKRPKGEEVEDRVCLVCMSRDVEDERHFLLKCPMYVRERSTMFRKMREVVGLEYAESMDEEWQMNVMIGVGWREQGREIREIVLEYIRKAYEIRKIYII